MAWEAWICLITLALALYALAKNLAGPDVILLGALTFLMTLSPFSDRFPSPRETAAVFGNEALLTVATLFVIAAGLTETGGLSVVTERLIGRPRTARAAQLRLMLPVTAVSAFLNNTPVVAMFMPIVSEVAKRANLSPSKLFIPLSYAAVLGGLCTLIGTSTNLVIQGLLIEAAKIDPTVQPFGMFTIGAVGLPVAIVGVAFIIAVGNRLPDRRTPRAAIADAREYTVEMLVQAGSPVAGRTIEDAGLRHLAGMFLASIERDGSSLIAVGPDQRLYGNDRLVFVGNVDSVVDLQRIRGLVPATDQVFTLDQPRHNRCLIEAVVSHASPLSGQSVRQGRFRTRYGAVVIAVHRSGERIEGKIGDIVLKPGDALLLEAHPTFLDTYRHSPDFFLVSAIEDSRPRRHERAWIAVTILAAMVTVVALENYTHVSTFNGALVAAGMMGLTGCVSAGQARRSMDWATLIAIGASLGLGQAVESTGLASAIASQIIDAFMWAGPRGVLCGVYLVTLLLTELVTNNAAAALAFPIALITSNEMGVSLMPFAIVVAVAASAGFATPLGYQTHLMVYGPGGYRFADYLRIGIPLDLLVMFVTLLLTPIFFPLNAS
jgi:di/tricarboxylate transporter